LRRRNNKKLKHILDKLEGDKKLLEFCLCECFDELSTKLHTIIKELYGSKLVETSFNFFSPESGGYIHFRDGKKYDETTLLDPDLLHQWGSNHNNNKEKSSNEIYCYQLTESFKQYFSPIPDISFAAHGSRSSSSLFPCCRTRKSNPLQVVRWPLIDSTKGEVVGIVFILLKPFAEPFIPALEKINPNIIKSYQRIMNEITNHQKFLLLNDLGSLFTKDLGELSRRIINKLTRTLHAESGVVFLVNKNSDELYTEAFGDKLLDEEFRLELCHSGFLFLYSQPSVQSLLIDKDTQIAADLNKLKEFAKIELNIEHLLVVPGYNEEGDEPIALFCLMNKKGSNTGFTTLDEELMSMVVKNCRHIVCNAIDWKNQLIIQRQNECLLDVSKTLFSHLDDVSVLLHNIMEEARKLTKAERCSLFLVDHEAGELIAKVFDGIESEGTEMRISINQGIAGHVATTGETLNIKDAYSHPLFYRTVDHITGFKTKHILCFPIRSISEQVIGVAQLCNKINGTCFTKFDEERTTGFAIFVGLSLVQSLLYKKAMDAQQRSKLANELMLYHMRVSAEDIEKYVNSPFPTKVEIDEKMDSFSFMPRISLAEHDTIKVVIAMFTDLDLVSRWKIKEHTLVRFVLTVRRGYRDVPYHNWTHAWTVAHFSYLLLKNTNAAKYLSDLEKFVLIVACLCHDIDHRGTNNSFQISSQSVLASLYSSAGSVLEHHHFAQAMCIIQTDFCNVFESLSRTDYSRALDLMKHMILATDLANHFKIDKQIEELAGTGVDKDNQVHRELLLSLCMTTSDLSDQTKPWESAIEVSDLLYAEFFAQGDQEKSLGYTPIQMMDREKASIPNLQSEFLSNIALPVYTKLANLFPETTCILSNINENREQWNLLKSQPQNNNHIQFHKKDNQTNS